LKNFDGEFKSTLILTNRLTRRNHFKIFIWIVKLMKTFEKSVTDSSDFTWFENTLKCQFFFFA
jgi:hypothetical protein